MSQFFISSVKKVEESVFDTWGCIKFRVLFFLMLLINLQIKNAQISFIVLIVFFVFRTQTEVFFSNKFPRPRLIFVATLIHRPMASRAMRKYVTKSQNWRSQFLRQSALWLSVINIRKYVLSNARAINTEIEFILTVTVKEKLQDWWKVEDNLVTICFVHSDQSVVYIR